MEPYYNTKELELDYQKQWDHQIRFMRKNNYQGFVDTRNIDFNSYKHDYDHNDYDNNDHDNRNNSGHKFDDTNVYHNDHHHDKGSRDPASNNNATNEMTPNKNENLHENDKSIKKFSSPNTTGANEIYLKLKKLHYSSQKGDKRVLNDVDNINIITYERNKKEEQKECNDDKLNVNLNKNKLENNQIFITMEKNSMESKKYANNNVIYVEGKNINDKTNMSNDNDNKNKHINKNKNEKINYSENLNFVWDNNEDFFDLKNEKMLEEDIDIEYIIKERENFNLLNRGNPLYPCCAFFHLYCCTLVASSQHFFLML
jgi:hypothetical protein